MAITEPPSRVYWVGNEDDETAVVGFWDGAQVTTISTADAAAWPGGKLTGVIRALGAGKVIASATWASHEAQWYDKYLHVFDSELLGFTVLNPPPGTYVDYLSTNELLAGGWYDEATEKFWISDGIERASETSTYMVLNSNLSFDKWAGGISGNADDGAVIAAATQVVGVGDVLYRCGQQGYWLNRYNMTTDTLEGSHFLGISVEARELVGHSATYGLVFLVRGSGEYGQYWLEAYDPDTIPWLSYEEWTSTAPTAAMQPTTQQWVLGQPWVPGELGPSEAEVAFSPYGAGWLKVLDDTRVAFSATDSVVPVTDNGGSGTSGSPYVEEGEKYAVWTFDLTTGQVERMFGIPYYYSSSDGVVTETGGSAIASLHFDLSDPGLPPPTTPPASVTQTGSTTTTVQIQWGPPPDSQDPVSYEVQIDEGTWVSPTGVMEHTFTGLLPGTVYSAAVRARNDGGVGPHAVITAATMDSIGVVEPTVTVGKTTLRFDWDTPETGPVPDGYSVQFDGGSPASVTETTFLMTGLSPSTTYTFQVRALKGSETGEPALVEATTTDSNPPTVVVVPGPEGDQPWAALHHGRYRVADFGERQGWVSFGCKVAANGNYWMKIFARWSAWNEETQSFDALAEAETLALGPVGIGDEGGEFGYTSSLFFDLEAPAGVSHWQPVIHWFATNPDAPGGLTEGLPFGGRVRIDNLYIPDNGYPVHGREYLDGDQPYGIWEGPRAASTSVYGDSAAAALARMVTLEPEFLIPDGDDLDLAALTYLDDDLKI